MNMKKFGGEEFGKTLEELKAMAPHTTTLNGIRFEGAAHKVNAILMLGAVGGELIAEIERLTTELEAARIDQEIAQFARDTTIIPGLGDALDPILDPLVSSVEEPATAEEWYKVMSLMIEAAKDSHLWPVLSPEQFEAFEKQLADNPADKNEALQALLARQASWAKGGAQ